MAAEPVVASTGSDGRWRVAFVAAADDPTSVADLDAGDLITYSLTADGFNPSTTQTKAEDKRLTLIQDLSRQGRVTEDLEVTYVRSTDSGSAHAVLVANTEGYIVVRRGVDNATAWTIGQKVDIYTIEAGVQRPNAPVENGVDTLSSTLFITAPTRYGVTLVA